ncbi:MAG: hypothetical protein H0T84_07880 [Tatlockia sp.]|nr:hypothetical protein [Tatlockia sp.]
MLNDKIGNPTKYYHHPEDVKKDKTLTTEEKIKVLENWLDDINLKLMAEDENMPSTNEGASNFIKEINEILGLYKSVST